MKYVIYRSEDYYKLDSNWVTWEIFTVEGVKLAKMLYKGKGF